MFYPLQRINGCEYIFIQNENWEKLMTHIVKPPLYAMFRLTARTACALILQQERWSVDVM